MGLDEAVRDATRSLGARPAEVLPFYVAGLAVPAIARVVPFLGILLAYLTLQGTGRVEAIREVLEPAAPIRLDDPDDVAGGETAVDETALEEALLDLLTPTVLAILVVTGLLALVLFAVMQAAVTAGRYHAVHAVLRDQPATRAGVEGVFADTWTYLGLVILELLAYLLLFGVPTLVVAVALATDVALLVLFAVPALLLAVVLSLAVRLGFAFARPAVVVDDAGVRGATRGAFGYVRGNPLQVLGYGVLAVGLVAVGNAVAGAFSQVGAVTASTLVPLVFVFPVLDLVKTSLYGGHRDVAYAPASAPEADRLPRLRAGVRRGWNELIGFTRGHLGVVAASAVVFAGGTAIGLWAGEQVDDLFVASIEARLEGSGPVGAFFHYAANNWSVAAGQSLSGLILGIPTLVSLAFNGANLGFLYQLEVDPEVLLAFVLPHGLIEIPALVLSGALGLHLGIVGWRYAFGSVDRERVAEAIDRAFLVLVGLAVLFVAAALIEAVVSPYYWRLLGI